jgi:MHS family proline/betaine transporter-like MFS transporter
MGMAAGGIPVDAATRRKAVVAATIGNFVEWYDFIIYGYFATVIAAQFFRSEDPLAGILATFAVFGVSFLVRPLGALIVGSYGDRLGRRGTLAVVILLMSGATFLIGIAPTYAQVGALAPIILALARALQGFSAGGEFGGRRRSWSSTPPRAAAPSTVAGRPSPRGSPPRPG